MGSVIEDGDLEEGLCGFEHHAVENRDLLVGEEPGAVGAGLVSVAVVDDPLWSLTYDPSMVRPTRYLHCTRESVCEGTCTLQLSCLPNVMGESSGVNVLPLL